MNEDVVYIITDEEKQAFKRLKTDEERQQFAVRGVTQGKDAQGEVTLELEVESGDRSFRGRAASTDIIEASALAYVNAVNAIATRRDHSEPREVIGRPGAGA